MAHTRGMLDKQGYTRMHRPTCPETNTHPGLRAHTQDIFVILVTFPLQRWFRERASVLRYTYIACIVQFLYCQFFISLPGI